MMSKLAWHAYFNALNMFLSFKWQLKKKCWTFMYRYKHTLIWSSVGAFLLGPFSWGSLLWTSTPWWQEVYVQCEFCILLTPALCTQRVSLALCMEILDIVINWSIHSAWMDPDPWGRASDGTNLPCWQNVDIQCEHCVWCIF
jgi:hypothetical protein